MITYRRAKIQMSKRIYSLKTGLVFIRDKKEREKVLQKKVTYVHKG